MGNQWDGDSSGSDVITDDRVREDIKEPIQQAVIILNDDFTPMDFVVDILKEIFHKTEEIATQLTMQVHKEGEAVAGIYTTEIAETKVMMVISAANSHDYPLLAELKPIQ